MSCHSKKLRILLAGDASVLQQTVKFLLESMGCIVSVVSTYRDVYKKFNVSFDGVLVDVAMPYGDGFDVVKYIHQNFQENKAIIYMYSSMGIERIQEKIDSLPINSIPQFFQLAIHTPVNYAAF